MTTPAGTPVRTVAFHLPQFHPDADNDRWWGPGFTEWTNVAQARPLFPGHYQPRIPGELGFYDQRLDETRHAQAALAQQHGITAFCYWHYWFAGRRILDIVPDLMLRTGVPDMPFCLGWANESWTNTQWAKTRGGAPAQVLLEQTYPGEDDDRRHFEALLEYFHDPRYLRIDGRPVLVVYRPCSLPDPQAFADRWQAEAQAAGLPGLYLVGFTGASGDFRPSLSGFDASIPWTYLPMAQRKAAEGRKAPDWYLSAASQRIAQVPDVFSYRHWAPYYPWLDPRETSYPCVIPGWDNTSRKGRQGLILHDATPEAFGDQVRRAVELVRHRSDDERLIFVRSWNEWAEGNYLEPDRKFGRAFLEAFRDALP